MIDLETAIKAFESKHANTDARIVSFQENVVGWISSLPEEIVPIVLQMICNFDYYTHQEANEMLFQLRERLTGEYGVNDQNALHTYLKKKNGRICSSVDYWSEYRLKNDIDKNLCTDDIKAIPENEWGQIQTIIIIDDCCGTGGSLETFIESSKRDFSGKTIYYLVLHALEAAIQRLDLYSKAHNIQIKLIAIQTQKPAALLVSSENAEVVRAEIVDASKKMNIHEDYVLGKDNSEGLMAFYNNTPNNTIGLFWYPSEKNVPIFPRDFGVTPPWRVSHKDMRQNRNRRKRSNYKAAKRNG